MNLHFLYKSFKNLFKIDLFFLNIEIYLNFFDKNISIKSKLIILQKYYIQIKQYFIFKYYRQIN